MPVLQLPSPSRTAVDSTLHTDWPGRLFFIAMMIGYGILGYVLRFDQP